MNADQIKKAAKVVGLLECAGVTAETVKLYEMDGKTYVAVLFRVGAP